MGTDPMPQRATFLWSNSSQCSELDPKEAGHAARGRVADITRSVTAMHAKCHLDPKSM